LLASITSSPTEYDEWYYFISIFGTPSADEPWGWQLDGHHLNINCFLLGDDMVLTPTFMGSEPCQVTTGPLAGVEVFAAELRGGLDLIRSLGPSQQEKAILYPSIMPGTLPAHLEHWMERRTQAGAFQDNAVLPYQGIRGDELSEAQRSVLMTTLGVHLGWARPDHAAVRAEQIADHLDETWFSWLGGTTGDEPFYYRIHSPVVLVEFDQHGGVVFDNAEPSRHHIHTIIRTPNGGDYGLDLLAHTTPGSTTAPAHTHRHKQPVDPELAMGARLPLMPRRARAEPSFGDRLCVWARRIWMRMACDADGQSEFQTDTYIADGRVGVRCRWPGAARNTRQTTRLAMENATADASDRRCRIIDRASVGFRRSARSIRRSFGSSICRRRVKTDPVST
jgi:hypothetical protein